MAAHLQVVIPVDSNEHMSRSRTSLVTFLVIFSALFVLNFWMIAPYLLPVFMGAILAILSQPFYRRLRDRRWGRTGAATAVTVGVLLVVIVPLGAFVTQAVQQGITLAQYLSANDQLSFQNIADQVSQWRPIRTLVGDSGVIERQIRLGLQGAGRALSGTVLEGFANLPVLLLQIGLALLACFFFLMDGVRFRDWLLARIPLDADLRVRISKSFQDTTVSVLWATLAAAGAQAVVIVIGFLVLGVPAAFLAGGLTFVFAWIPILGSFPISFAGALYLFFQGSTLKLIGMVIVAIIAGFVDNFVRPLVLKGRSDMHPLISLVAIFGGIELFGIFGAFYGPILMSIFITLAQLWPVVEVRSGISTAAVITRKEKEGSERESA